MTGNIVYPLPRQLPVSLSLSQGASRCAEPLESPWNLCVCQLATTTSWQHAAESLKYCIFPFHSSTFPRSTTPSLPVAGPRLLSALRFWQFSTADFPISAHFVTATRSLLKIFVLATNPHPNPNAEWEWKFESDGGWRNGECECDAIFISLCLFVFVSLSLCLCVRQTEGKDTRKTQQECVGGSANTKLIERERKRAKRFASLLPQRCLTYNLAGQRKQQQQQEQRQQHVKEKTKLRANKNKSRNKQ